MSSREGVKGVRGCRFKGSHFDVALIADRQGNLSKRQWACWSDPVLKRTQHSPEFKQLTQITTGMSEHLFNSVHTWVVSV